MDFYWLGTFVPFEKTQNGWKKFKKNYKNLEKIPKSTWKKVWINYEMDEKLKLQRVLSMQPMNTN